MTAPERRLWYGFLRALPVRFLRQKPLLKYIVDFYSPRLRLAIELDGDSHFDPGSAAYDKRRDDSLARYGIEVLRFTNEDVNNSFVAVCDVILQRIKNPPGAARRPPLSRG